MTSIWQQIYTTAHPIWGLTDRLNMTLANWIAIDCTSRDAITLGNCSWQICNKCLVNMKAFFDFGLFTLYQSTEYMCSFKHRFGDIDS